MRVSVLWAFARALLVLATCVPIVHAEETRAPVEVRILAINDFHGNLMPPPGGIQIPDPDNRPKKVTVPAGGSEHMAALIKELRAGRSNTIFVAAGDLIGASPLLSSLFHDEPTIDSLSLMGLDLSSVGNHEFDKGKIELLRMQYGGCHADGAARDRIDFTARSFTISRRTSSRSRPERPCSRHRTSGISMAFRLPSSVSQRGTRRAS
jgi:5'-nucleotidase